jgi:hypothetical protein
MVKVSLGALRRLSESISRMDAASVSRMAVESLSLNEPESAIMALFSGSVSLPNFLLFPGGWDHRLFSRPDLSG